MAKKLTQTTAEAFTNIVTTSEELDKEAEIKDLQDELVQLLKESNALNSKKRGQPAKYKECIKTSFNVEKEDWEKFKIIASLSGYKPMELLNQLIKQKITEDDEKLQIAENFIKR